MGGEGADCSPPTTELPVILLPIILHHSIPCKHSCRTVQAMAPGSKTETTIQSTQILCIRAHVHPTHLLPSPEEETRSSMRLLQSYRVHNIRLIRVGSQLILRRRSLVIHHTLRPSITIYTYIGISIRTLHTTSRTYQNIHLICSKDSCTRTFEGLDVSMFSR